MLEIKDIENQIFNADCLDILKQIHDKSIDCVITSPPYNLGNLHHTGNKKHRPYNDNIPEPEYKLWQIKILNEFFRIIKDDGNIFYNHKNRIKDGFCISPLEWILQSKLKLKQEIVWEVGSQNFDSIRFYPFTERIYWLSKKNTKIQNSLGLSDLWLKHKIGVEGTNKEHTRAFPEILAKNLIKVSTNENDLILDPFLGSGTTAIACYDLKRRYIGIEKEERYYNIAKKRIDNFKAQMRLF